jgi:hypothetical protein
VHEFEHVLSIIIIGPGLLRMATGAMKIWMKYLSPHTANPSFRELGPGPELAKLAF